MLCKATDQSCAELEGYNMKKMLWVLALFSLVCAVRPVHAIPFTFTFEASGFVREADPTVPPPDDPVSGSISYDAAAQRAPIDSLTSLNLTIDGHTYDVGEVGFLLTGAGEQVVGAIVQAGAVFGPDRVRTGRNDFLVQWDPATLTLQRFVYASENVEDTTFSATTLTSGNPVSEPATLPLAVLATGLIAVFAGKRRKAGGPVSPQAIASC